MDVISVVMRNPFALRECLEVALEVTWPDLGTEQVACLRSLVRGIPCTVAAVELSVGPCEREVLLACATHFRRSRTCYWLRSDLGDALTDLAQQLQCE